MAAMYFCTIGQSNRKSSTHSAEEWAPHDKDGENDMVACLLSAGSVLRKQFAAICYAEGMLHGVVLPIPWCISLQAVHCINLAYLCQISYLI